MILEMMSQESGVALERLEAVVRNASYRYKRYTIPKRTGGRREICHPTPALKYMQRWLVKKVFCNFLINEFVYSYREGLGIKEHAGHHVRKKYLLRIDFRDFFPSIKSSDIERLINKNRQRIPFEFPDEDIVRMTKIVCRKERLTIGAPSSPVLSNAVLYDFDGLWRRRCKESGVAYTRYADDLYISTNTPSILSGIHSGIVDDISQREWPRLSINHSKTVFSSKKRKMSVTGLILTNDGYVSIGRKRKRYIRGLVHKLTIGHLDVKMVSYLRGYLAYSKSVDPVFVDNLRRKYGGDFVNEIMGLPAVRRKS